MCSTGRTGPTGFTGSNGFTGPTGDIGPQGIQRIQCIQGSAATSNASFNNISVTNSFTGATGIFTNLTITSLAGSDEILILFQWSNRSFFLFIFYERRYHRFNSSK